MSSNIFKAVSPFVMGVSLTSATYGYVNTKHFVVFAMIVILNAVSLWLYIYAVKTEPVTYSKQVVLDYAVEKVAEALRDQKEDRVDGQ